MSSKRRPRLNLPLKKSVVMYFQTSFFSDGKLRMKCCGFINPMDMSVASTMMPKMITFVIGFRVDMNWSMSIADNAVATRHLNG